MADSHYRSLELEGQTAAGGVRSRDRLARVLGISALTKQGASVTAAAWVVDHVEVEVEQPGDDSIVIVIERAREGRPALLRTSRLALGFHGPSIHPLVKAALRRVAPVGLAKLDLERLAQLFLVDPELGNRGLPIPTRAETDQRRFEQRSLIATWGSTTIWSEFFATAEISRSQLDSLDYFNRSLFIQHCDPECVFLAPQTGVPMVPAALFPWDDRIRRIDWRRPGARLEPDPLTARLVTTDLDEADVILGRGPEKLDAALRAVRDGEVGPEAELIFCANTCVPVVSGEDVDSVVARYASEMPATFLHLTTTPTSMHSLLGDLFVERRLEAERAVTEQRERSINLLGFSDDPPLRELEELLDEGGVSVNTKLIPSVSRDAIADLPRACLSVFNPIELWQAHYDQLLFESKILAISPPAPYGVDGTMGWIQEISRALSLSDTPRSLVRDRTSRVRSELAEMSARTGRHRLAVIVAKGEGDRLLNPSKTWGAPVVAFLRELGFGVEVLVQAAADDQVLEQLESQLDVEARRFETRAELIELLEGGGLSAAFSEQLFDRRLSELGIGTFSLQHFELGFEGAVRTARRLLEICELPFSRRYGRYLARARALRASPPAPFGPIV
jgi:hypothetical protein